RVFPFLPQIGSEDAGGTRLRAQRCTNRVQPRDVARQVGLLRRNDGFVDELPHLGLQLIGARRKTEHAHASAPLLSRAAGGFASGSGRQSRGTRISTARLWRMRLSKTFPCRCSISRLRAAPSLVSRTISLV